MFYRDYPPQSTTYVTKVKDFTENPSEVRTFIREEGSGQGGDAPEAVFEGLSVAIENIRKRSSNGDFKVIILIGEAGNHATDPEGHTEESIGESLSLNGVDFFSIQVADPAESSPSPAKKRFREQVIAIQEKMSEVEGLNRFYVTKDTGKMVDEIVDSVLLSPIQFRKDHDAAREVEAGTGIQDIKDKYGVFVTQRLSRRMIEYGVDPTHFIRNSLQVFQEGYVAANDDETGLSQIETFVLVDRASMGELQTAMATFAKNPPNTDSLFRIWQKALVDLNTGEKDVDSKPLRELIENQLGLPLRGKLLSYSLNDINEMKPHEYEEMYWELKTDNSLLYFLGIDQDAEIYLQKIEHAGGRHEWKIETVGEPRNRKWWYMPSQSLEYAWIPLDKLP